MKINKKKILITGGAGFIGYHIVNALLNQEADVTILLQPYEKTWRLELIKNKINIVKDSLVNQEGIRSLIKKTSPEVIIHLAGLMERRRDLSILEELHKYHVIGTINLLRSIDKKTTKLIINTGTSEEYGEQVDPFLETMATDPVSPYSATKAATTAIAIYLSKATGVPIVTMRPFIIYGPFQLHDTLIPFLIKCALQKKMIDLTEGLQYRDFLYVTDLVSCYLSVIEKAESIMGHEILNVGSGHPTKIHDVIKTLAGQLDAHDLLRIGARKMRAGETPSMIADIKKAKELIGWQPKVTLEEGLRATIDWWRKNERFWKG